MHLRVLLAISLAATVPQAVAQTLPPTGVLQAPPKTPQPTAPQATPSSNPPAPAPRAAVQQVAPMATPSLLGQSTPGKPPPVVQPPANTHAQKPPPPKTPTPKAPKPPTKPSAAPAVAATGAATTAVKPPEPVPPAATRPAEPGIGTVTKQPIPRWASLRSDEVNLRTGPGTRYPIEWVYRRRDLPVEIEREFEAWRLIADQDGVKGWVHSATLVGRRSFVVKGKDRALRKTAADDAAAVAILKPGVVGRLRACDPAKTWCELQVGDHRGWLKREDIWGVYPGEAVN